MFTFVYNSISRHWVTWDTPRTSSSPLSSPGTDCGPQQVRNRLPNPSSSSNSVLRLCHWDTPGDGWDSHELVDLLNQPGRERGHVLLSVPPVESLQELRSFLSIFVPPSLLSPAPPAGLSHRVRLQSLLEPHGRLLAARPAGAQPAHCMAAGLVLLILREEHLKDLSQGRSTRWLPLPIIVYFVLKLEIQIIIVIFLHFLSFIKATPTSENFKTL